MSLNERPILYFKLSVIHTILKLSRQGGLMCHHQPFRCSTVGNESKSCKSRSMDFWTLPGLVLRLGGKERSSKVPDDAKSTMSTMFFLVNIMSISGLADIPM